MWVEDVRNYFFKRFPIINKVKRNNIMNNYTKFNISFNKLINYYSIKNY